MMRFLRSGLYVRFILAMVSLAVVPALFMGFLLMRISQTGIQASVLELHTKLAEKLAERVQGDLRTLDDKLRFTLNAVQKSNMDWTGKQDLLRSLIDAHSDIQEISVVKGNGMELLKVYNPALTDSPALLSRADDPGFKEFLRTQGRTVTIAAREAAAPALDIYYPLNAMICLRVSAQLKGLWDSIGQERVGGTGFAMVVGPKGEPLMYPTERLSAGLRASIAQWPIVKAALGAHSIGSSEYQDGAGQWQVGAYAPIPDIRGAVLIQQNKAEAYLASQKMRQTATFVFVVFGAVAFAVAAFMARQLTRPLLVLTRAAHEVADGRFPGVVQLETHDELQDLGDTFNVMVAKLKAYAELQVDRLVAEQTKTGAILFSIGDGILMLDHDGRIQLANRRGKELIGVMGPESIDGKKLEDVVGAGNLRSTLDAAAANPKDDVFKECDLSTEQYRRILRISALPVTVPEKGTALGIVIAIRDVTIEKQLDKMKEEFLHSITHDLRNPVGSAIGFAEFLLKGVVGVLNTQQQGMVESIRKACSRLLTMVNNILDLAKLEAGKMEVHLKECSLAGVAGHALDILGSLAQRRGLKLELEADEEFTINADPDLMERCITNLVGNAIKFAAEDGKVKVKFFDEGEQIKFCVEDDGEGIPPEHVGRIFEKFEQVPGQRKGGTGLGLTIVRHIVDGHLGRVWVESDVGKGARFYVTIPKDLVAGEGCKVTRKAALTRT
ncbi:MAG: HAMP domain-containing protein [Elusimicrobia bacterium]|nr:HAMP domain-containing protein [Elusimicrobiota bacterium]